jgi:hypothetical protein
MQSTGAGRAGGVNMNMTYGIVGIVVIVVVVLIVMQML